LVQVTFVPTGTVIEAGEKAKPEIVTAFWTLPEDALGAELAPAGLAADPAELGVAVGVHATSATETTSMSPTADSRCRPVIMVPPDAR
jgi:hypothetical protein